MRRSLTRRLLSIGHGDVGGGRRSATEVTVRRVHWQTTYARVSTVGRTGDRAFVLVPGIGVSSNYFERLAGLLNEYGPVHALDLPGFGGVPHPKSRRMTISEYADLVGTVIDELELDDPIVVGHSMGTQVVAELASRYPAGFAGHKALSTVILLGPVLYPAERHLGVAGRRFLQAARKEPPRVAVLALQAYALCGVRWFSRVLPEMLQYPIEDVLPEVTANTLVISGSEDDLCPRVWIDQVAGLLPSCRVSIIPGAAHSIMHAHADVVAQLSVQHVRRPGTEPLSLPDGGSDAEEYPAGLGQVSGQLTELVGIVTDDDTLIAEGKTAQAEAVEEHSDDAGQPAPEDPQPDPHADARAGSDDPHPDAGGEGPAPSDGERAEVS
ncbi:hypothetical protein GCM10022204_42840 [Microlunatus aurantiacus]|uniref:AB hydrolase-1 domain-containing protein n=1 Tax=Microlunatus aurantiacus TaxID=446786 RepID=A0ABP7EHN8_9ACTN